ISQLEFYSYYGVDKCIDAFDNPYEYRCPGENNPKAFDLRSIGPDNLEDTEDDITNWQRN
ncbi:MAG: type II secretion system protein GspG, partial [Lentisphaeria bacterium]